MNTVLQSLLTVAICLCLAQDVPAQGSTTAEPPPEPPSVLEERNRWTKVLKGTLPHGATGQALQETIVVLPLLQRGGHVQPGRDEAEGVDLLNPAAPIVDGGGARP